VTASTLIKSIAQQQVAKLAMTAIDYPPMQRRASFNLDAVKAETEEAIKKQHAD
jgi:arylsulfatase